MRFCSLTLMCGMLLGSGAAIAADVACSTTSVGPQAPRDITSKAGTNPNKFALATDITKMNLCNIHFHRYAEHRAAAFSVGLPKPAGQNTSAPPGYTCNDASALTTRQKTNVPGHCKEVEAGSTIEVHWVYTSCGVDAADFKKPKLGACIPSGCSNPSLRVESQVFLVVNDATAADIKAYDLKARAPTDTYFQAKTLPSAKGAVLFRGSTTGGDYNNSTKCSDKSATWNVRPTCMRLDITKLHAWCGESNNKFGEDEGHSVRALVTDAKYLDHLP